MCQVIEPPRRMAGPWPSGAGRTSSSPPSASSRRPDRLCFVNKDHKHTYIHTYIQYIRT